MFRFMMISDLKNVEQDSFSYSFLVEVDKLSSHFFHLCLFCFVREELLEFSSTGSVTWTLIPQTVNQHTPSVVLISERIRPTLVTITGELPAPNTDFSIVQHSTCTHDFCTTLQVCQILQKGWGRVPDTYQSLRHPSGCHSSRTRESILRHHYTSLSAHSGHCCYILLHFLFQAGKFSPIPTIISTVTAMTSVGIVSNYNIPVLSLRLWSGRYRFLQHKLLFSSHLNPPVHHYLRLDHADVYWQEWSLQWQKVWWSEYMASCIQQQHKWSFLFFLFYTLKDLQSWEVKVCTNRSSSLPQKTLLIKSSFFCTWEFIKQSCSVVVSGAGSDMCELTNQSRLGIQEEEP